MSLRYDVLEEVFLMGLDGLEIPDEAVRVQTGRLNHKSLGILAAQRLKNNLLSEHADLLAIGTINYSPIYRIVPA